MTPVEAVPLAGLLPVQPFDAMQDDALLAAQERVDALPLWIVLGLEVIDRVGAGDETDTVADCEALPPGPLQVTRYVVVEDKVPVERVPLVGRLPLHPPPAVQAVAFWEDQVRVELFPEITVVGPALRVTDGADAETVTTTDWVVVPPGPVQVSP